jgi:hypothetical protein
MIETSHMNPQDDQFYEQHGALPPHILEQIVDEIPDLPAIDPADYTSVITRLHDEKDFSFRDIELFLKKHGVATNRSAVYRVYKEANPQARKSQEESPLIDEDTGETVEP